MSKLSVLKKWFTVPEAIEKIKKLSNIKLSESDLYQFALQKDITISLLIHEKIHDTQLRFSASKKDTQYYKEISKKLHTIYTTTDPQELASITFSSNGKLESFDEWCKINDMYHNFETHDNIIYKIRDSKYSIEGIWDIISPYRFTEKTAISISNIGYTKGDDLEVGTDLPLLKYCYNKSINKSFNDNKCYTYPFYLRSIDKTQIALIYPDLNSSRYLQPSSVLPQIPSGITLVVRQENLDKFINTFKQNNFTQEAKTTDLEEPIKTSQYNNLVALIGFLLTHPNRIPTTKDHTIIVNKLLTAFESNPYKIYKKEALTKIIKDALRLIEERDESN